MTSTRLLLIIGSAIYVWFLQVLYPAIIVPAFGYAAMTYREQSWSVFVFQCICAWLPGFWLPKSFVRPSQYQCWILYLTVVAPSCILPYHVTALPSHQIHNFTLAVLALFLVLCLSTAKAPRRLKRHPLPLGGFALLLGATTTLTYGWLFLIFGMQSVFLPVDQVYELRTELRSASMPTLLGYLIWWQGTVVNPVISAIGFQRRQWLPVLLSLVLQVQLYSITSLRTFLAAAAFQLGIGIFLIVFRHRRGMYLIHAMNAVMVTAACWYFVDSRALAPLLLLERWVYNAGQLSGLYYEYFSQHASAGLSHSAVPILRWLVPGPYDLPVGQVIGREYFFLGSDGVYTNATAHFWADGFAIAGYVGMVVATLLAIVLLKLADMTCRGHTPQVVIMSFAIVGMSLIGQGVLTTVLTGGFAPFLILMYFIPSLTRERFARQAE